MNEYRIKLGSLTNGTNSFCFNIKDKFFEEFPLSEVKCANIVAIAKVEKENNNLQLELKLEGEIYKLLCDTCAEDLSLKIKTKTKVIIQRFNHKESFNDDVIFIEEHRNSIDLKQLIFESIILNIPKKRKHTPNEDGKLNCNKEMIDLIKKYSLKTNSYSDKRWEVLKNLNLK